MKTATLLSFAIGMSILLGCGRPCLEGKSVYSLFTTGQVTFACSSVQAVTQNNQRGYPVPGIVILDASLIKSTFEMTNSVRRKFVFFKDPFFGGLVAGSYWEQVAETNTAIGFAMMNSWPTKVIITETDDVGIVTNAITLKAGNAAIAVDAADFGRRFTGIY